MALRQKMATGVAAALLLSGLTGVAVASNGAAPGSILYELDQALEDFGIGDGGAEERIAEAQALFNEGQVAEAVAHAAQAVEAQAETESEIENIEVLTSEEAIDALEAVAEKLTMDGNDANDHAATVVSNVADLLKYMATTTDTGSDFGQTVASMAGNISPAPDELPAPAGDAADNAAEEAVDNGDTAEGSADEGLDTADDNTEEAPSGRP